MKIKIMSLSFVLILIVIMSFIAFADLMETPDEFLISEYLGPCDINNNHSRCGELISEVGHGAVELCEHCHICGYEDGVCPAWYSTGAVSDELFNITLRKGRNDRPQYDTPIVPASFKKFEINYDTGKEACEYFGGIFHSAYSKEFYEDNWALNDGIGESTSMSGRTDYVFALCENTSLRPSCDVCIDPDCKTSLVGAAYTYHKDSGIEELENVSIIVLPAYDEEELYLRRNATSNADGSFEVENAYSGEVYVYCLAEGFTPTREKITLKPGKNIVDCRLSHAECDEDCTVPSGLHYGVRVCSKYCDGRNGCDYGHGFQITDDQGNTENLTGPIPSGPLVFNRTSIKDAAHGRQPGYFHKFHEIVDQANDRVRLIGLETCNDYAAFRTYPLFNVQAGDDISSLLTRRFNKILPDGTPVFLNIIVYNK